MTSPDSSHRAAAEGVSARVLVTDPQGRRVGFDPASHTLVNEIGERAFIIPANGTEPETIVIDAAVEGSYAVTAFSPGGGPYSITTDVNGVEGDSLATETVEGVAAPGAVIAASTPTLTGAMPGLQLHLNQASFTRGDTLTVSANLGTLPIARPVDAYVVVQLPGGALLSLQRDGSLVPGIVPIAKAFVPFDFEGQVAQYMFTGAEPKGTYTWYSVLTEGGTMNFVSPLRQINFTVP
jgi:hypothetical protein